MTLDGSGEFVVSGEGESRLFYVNGVLVAHLRRCSTGWRWRLDGDKAWRGREEHQHRACQLAWRAWYFRESGVEGVCIA